MNILFRCDGSHEIGLGHVVRCMALADELKEGCGCRVMFAMRESDLGKSIVSSQYEVIHLEHDMDGLHHRQCLENAIKRFSADVLVLDVREGLPKKDLDALKTDTLLVVDIDDPEEKRLSADLAFYPPVPQANRLDWTGFSGNAFVGWEWVILRKTFRRRNLQFTGKNPDIFKVMVTMGGSDPLGLTVKVLAALGEIAGPIEITAVLGKGFSSRAKLENVLSGISHAVLIQKNVQDMATVMEQMDLAVVSFGMTAYELAAMGVPAVYLCISPDHLKSAEMFVERRLAYHAWPCGRRTFDGLSKVLKTCIDNNYLKKQMNRQSPGIIDGFGAKRIAAQIMVHHKSMKKLKRMAV